MTLREFLQTLGGEFYARWNIRIYSKNNARSVCGSIIEGRLLIPQNVLDYKYISMKIEKNTRIPGKEVIVITVE